MNDKTFDSIVNRWNEIVDVPPQDVGKLTAYYKKITKRLKVMPWPVLFVLSVFVILLVFFLLGPAVIYLVEMIQRGF